MVAQEDEELFPWLCGAGAHAGDFLKSIANAGLRADPQNYAIIREALLALRWKYPNYHDDELEKMKRDGYTSTIDQVRDELMKKRGPGWQRETDQNR